jgi:hypothetical protein
VRCEREHAVGGGLDACCVAHLAVERREAAPLLFQQRHRSGALPVEAVLVLFGGGHELVVGLAGLRALRQLEGVGDERES